MRTLQLQGVILAFVATCTPSLAGNGCQQEAQFNWVRAGKTNEGYSIRLVNPVDARKQLGWGGSSDRAYAAANQLPPNRASLIAPAEFLSHEGSAAVFFVGHATVGVPISLDAVWHGADPLSCLRSFGSAAGFDVVVPEPDLWLVGSRDMVEHAAIEVFSYPFAAAVARLEVEGVTATLDKTLVENLPIRRIGPLALIGLGYYAIPGEAGNYLVVVTHGSRLPPVDSDELEGWAFKVHVEQEDGQPRVACLWERGTSGPLLAAVQEDFDGDGVRDFYFQAAGNGPDLIVSGSDGSTLAAVATGSLAVEESAPGPKRFAVDSMWDSPQGHPVVCRVSPEARKAVVVQPETKAEALGSETARPRLHEEPHRPRGVLAEALGRREGIRNYVLPGSRPPGYRTPQVPGVEYVEVQSPAVWEWFINKSVKKVIESTPGDLPVRIVFRYLSPGYVAEREREKQQAERR